MTNNRFTEKKRKLTGFFLFFLLLFSFACEGVSAQGGAIAAGEMENLIDGIVSWKTAQARCTSVQDLIDKGLTPYAGTSPTEWYVIALRQYKGGYDYTAYTAALNRYAAGTANAKATDLQRIALALSATGGNAEFIQNTIDGSTGKLGVMSYIYGLILLDSGAYTSPQISRNAIIDTLLSLALPDGGWALSGNTSDVDVTSMAVQALAPYCPYDDVGTAVEKALTLLSSRQLENGDYASWGTRNAESTAQVMTALAALNIDFQNDGRFIKNGNNLLDGLLLYRLADGSFSHTLGGASNNTAGVQALYSLVAAWRQSKGLGAIWRFTGQPVGRYGDPSAPPTAPESSPDSTGPASEPTDPVNSSADSRQPSGAPDSSPDAGQTTSAAAVLSEPAPGTGLPAASSATEPSAADPHSVNYKVWAGIAIGILGLLAVCILFVTKKNHKKNILLAAALTAGAMLAVLLTNIQTVDQYYLSHIDDIRSGSKTVFLSIRCDTALDKLSADYLPSDGIVLAKTEYVLRDGDTVFDVLERAVRFNRIQMEYGGSKGNLVNTVYVKGIRYLYEYACGDTSGWMYKVNGRFQNVGCDQYALSDGDAVEWVYTCDLGKDVGFE